MRDPTSYPEEDWLFVRGTLKVFIDFFQSTLLKASCVLLHKYQQYVYCSRWELLRRGINSTGIKMT